jgi:hypothetical protein
VAEQVCVFTCNCLKGLQHLHSLFRSWSRVFFHGLENLIRDRREQI